MFLPDGNLDRDRVETSLRMEDLEEERGSGEPDGRRAAQDTPQRPRAAPPAPTRARATHKPGAISQVKI